jgi:pimeloyl-ACP methyl ester carboxylesterase
MTIPVPHVRRSGSGPVVVCLHSNASTGGQWRTLAERLADRFTVLAVDGLGAGRSPGWPQAPADGLAAELALLQPVLEEAGDGIHLVGHSYGGAVALKAAALLGSRVRSVAVYEPTMFWLLGDPRRCEPSVQGIRDAVSASLEALARDDEDAAARSFIDFWMGAGSWDATPEARRAPIARSVRDVGRWAHALFSDGLSRADLAALDVPVLVMVGGRSPSAGRAPAAEILAAVPRGERMDFEGLGHMGPLTHPGVVDAAIEAFLVRGGAGLSARG